MPDPTPDPTPDQPTHPTKRSRKRSAKAARQELVSRAARLAFPIRDGVPVMTPDEARPVDDDELRALAKRCGSAKPAT